MKRLGFDKVRLNVRANGIAYLARVKIFMVSPGVIKNYYLAWLGNY
jgi:hypothetical protein